MTDLERKRDLARKRQRRWRRNIAARRICTTIEIDESGLQALVCAGYLPDELAHLKEEIRKSAQNAFDHFTVETLKKAGFL